MITIHLWLPDFYQPERNGLYLASMRVPVAAWRRYIDYWLKEPQGSPVSVSMWMPVRVIQRHGYPFDLCLHCNALPL